MQEPKLKFTFGVNKNIMKTLISMTDFVLEQKRPTPSADLHELDYYHEEYLVLERISNYAAFLKQPLKLEMFVPCVNGEPLDEFIHNINLTTMSGDWNKAKEKVLFEGFHSIGDKEIELLNSDNWISFTEKSIDFTNEFGHETQIYRIEDLIELELKLTPTALKQIGI